jgi:hypothetical protein
VKKIKNQIEEIIKNTQCKNANNLNKDKDEKTEIKIIVFYKKIKKKKIIIKIIFRLLLL